MEEGNWSHLNNTTQQTLAQLLLLGKRLLSRHGTQCIIYLSYGHGVGAFNGTILAKPCKTASDIA